jgi:hypothetical protein
LEAQLDAAGRERVRAANLAQIRQWGIVAVEASGVYALARKAVSFGQEKAMPKACFLKTNWMKCFREKPPLRPALELCCGFPCLLLPAQCSA